MGVVDLIGYLAATLTSSMMLPQIIMTLRTKNVAHLSGMMISLYVSSCLLWIVYGVLIHALPVILCNVIAVVMGFVQAFLQYRYRR